MSKGGGASKIITFAKAVGGSPDPAVIESAVSDWLDDHPEATTTVEDGSISIEKLDSELAEDIGEISELKEAIENISEETGGGASRNFFDDSDFQNKTGITISDGVYSGIANDIKTMSATSWKVILKPENGTLSRFTLTRTERRERTETEFRFSSCIPMTP